MQNIIIGHRGAAGLAPENTLLSFQKAFEVGCRFIEFDVKLSLDGEAFVFHDDTLNRTTNGRGQFGQATAAYIKSLDAGAWFSPACVGASVPTLQETIDWLIQHEMTANIEIKPDRGCVEETTMAVLSHIEQYWPKQKPWPLLSSFQYEALALCAKHRPDLPLGLLLNVWRRDWRGLAEKINCDWIHISLKAASKAHIDEIKRYGYPVLVYTVNDPSLARKLFDWGVDGLFSDYPDMIWTS